MAELVLHKISKKFGGLLAVDNLDLEVPKGKILSLIGPNGAGKTTVFNMVTGVYPPSQGTIAYRGKKINNMMSSRIISQGIARTFQNIRLFNSMTVLENVQVGMHCRTKSGAFRALFKTPFERREENEMQENFEDLADIVQAVEHGDAARARSMAQTQVQRFNRYMEKQKELKTQ